MMFPTVLPVPRTSSSLGTGAVCFLAQAGSASIASGLRVGAFPSKVTVPVIDDAAKATPGQSDTATSPAASNNLVPVTRMLGSLVLATLVCAATVDAACSSALSGPTLHPARCECNPLRPRVVTVRVPRHWRAPALHGWGRPLSSSYARETTQEVDMGLPLDLSTG